MAKTFPKVVYVEIDSKNPLLKGGSKQLYLDSTDTSRPYDAIYVKGFKNKRDNKWYAQLIAVSDAAQTAVKNSFSLDDLGVMRRTGVPSRTYDLKGWAAVGDRVQMDLMLANSKKPQGKAAVPVKGTELGRRRFGSNSD